MLVDLVENEFVPLAIKNNVPGADAAVLAEYKEPTWNNPVVRYFGADGTELISRKDRVWDEPAVIARTAAALEAAKVERPGYFDLLVTENTATKTNEALFSMY